jgi:hypothetical protein
MQWVLHVAIMGVARSHNECAKPRASGRHGLFEQELLGGLGESGMSKREATAGIEPAYPVLQTGA